MQIIFTFETQHGAFTDALHLDDDHTFTDEELQAMKQQRLDNWLAIMTSPAVEEPAQDYIEIDGVCDAKVS